MAIQMRRGLRKDFQPSKMLPGEWAVSIDVATDNQIVWMCFAPGVTKRMGTYEDFKRQIEEATADILNEYRTQLNIILNEVKTLAQQVRSDKDSVAIIKTEILTVYIPQMQKLLEDTAKQADRAKSEADKSEISANDSKTSADNSAASAKESEDFSKLAESHNHGGTGVRDGEDTDNSKYWSDQSKKHLDDTVQAGVEAVGDIGNAESGALVSIGDAKKDALDAIDRALDSAAPEFYLDKETKILYYQGGSFNFYLENGVLYWEVAN